MDYSLVQTLRSEVAGQLRAERRRHAERGLELSVADERALGRSLISRALQAHRQNELIRGIQLPGPEEDTEIGAAVHAALFGLGRLEPLINDPD
ncbi:MAG TPA: CpaF family protein, partial [Actinomycetes bacterium]|nr:CpaF family protein [Actinomycetes bacterium]